jgi:hypothetical protein
MDQMSPDPTPAPAPSATSAADDQRPSAIPTATSFATQANALFRKNITFQVSHLVAFHFHDPFSSFALFVFCK